MSESQSLLIWMVALAATSQTFLEAGAALIHRDYGLVLLFFLGAIGIFFLAFFIETYKPEEEE